jgi:hypothetical protein
MLIKWIRQCINFLNPGKTGLNISADLREDIQRIFPLSSFPGADPELLIYRIKKASHEVMSNGGKLASEEEFKDLVITPPLCVLSFCELCSQNGIDPQHPEFSSEELQQVLRIKQQLSEYASQDKEFRTQIISRIDAYRVNLKQNGMLVDASRAALLESILMSSEKNWSGFPLIYELITRSISVGAIIRMDRDNIVKIFGEHMKFRLFNINELKTIASA